MSVAPVQLAPIDGVHLAADNKLKLRLREIIAMRINSRTRSHYLWYQHYLIVTQEAGFSETEIQNS